MARFGLTQVEMPNFAAYITPEDKEERPVQKIERFATFLNEIPFIPKDLFSDDDEEGEEDKLDPNMAGYVPAEARETAEGRMPSGSVDTTGMTPEDADKAKYAAAQQAYQEDIAPEIQKAEAEVALDENLTKGLEDAFREARIKRSMQFGGDRSPSRYPANRNIMGGYKDRPSEVDKENKRK